jgi:uncharacterized protein
MEYMTGGDCGLRTASRSTRGWPGRRDLTVFCGTIPFNSRSHILESRSTRPYRELVDPGAFDRSLAAGHDLLCRRDHDPDQNLGSLHDGTLRVVVDGALGLRFEVDHDPQLDYARTLKLLLEHGGRVGVSFRFGSAVDRWSSYRDGGPPLRTLLDVDLYELSFLSVVDCAYPCSTASLGRRSIPISVSH